ncbi:LysR substrate-binding domain-containing protein [Nakamurella deserti]|uniref:LysR substrate-binding domain-containing protein n=1 Tax=Nakamurella deserti TaxID=2164074 RepID=UPI000DBE9B74|nr:LysR substrate-binding domain-containing protein [Nakamurella deserti]
MSTSHHLQTLEAVCRHASFAVAARELGYTPSAVSQQMLALERSTRLTLFERQPHGIRPTRVALDLVDAGRRVLSALDDFDRHVRDLAAGTTGRLRMGSFPTASVRVVPRALAAFARRHPRSEVQLTECEPDDAVTMVMDGRLDVALVYSYGLDPRTWPVGTGLHPLLTEELLLLQPIAREGDAVSGGGKVSLDGLAGARWISSHDGSAGARSFERLCATAGFAPEVVFRTNNYDVVRELVATGFGIAVIPMLGHRPDRRIDAVAVPGPASFRRVSVLHRDATDHPLLADAIGALTHSAARLAPGTDAAPT